MFETIEDVTNAISAGEDSAAEFKELRFGASGVRSPNAEAIAEGLVAFANTDGGAIILGISDEGVVKGIPIERLAEVERWIVNIATQNCDPPIRPRLRSFSLPTAGGNLGTVVVVGVGPGLYVHRTTGGRYYLRIGSSKQELTTRELARLMQERERTFVFDEQRVPSATGRDLDMRRLESFFVNTELESSEQDILRNIQVLDLDSNGVERPTVAGLLAFGESPEKHLPSAFIEAAVYSGVDLWSPHLVYSDQIRGNVGRQIDDAEAFIQRFMLKPARKPVGRIDYPQYDIHAVHEAIVNAVVHRDYSMRGAKIRLFLFSDRLELYSPGALLNTLTTQNMRYRVNTRNALLVRFLSKINSRRFRKAFIESRGEGVQRILRASLQHSGRLPVYELFDHELRLTIWAKRPPA